jgi:protein-disulfide isomerase
MLSEALQGLPDSVKAEIVVTYRFLPLHIHAWATDAARYAACVYQQSNEAFWMLQRKLYEQQNQIRPETLEKTLVSLLESSDYSGRVSSVLSCVHAGGGDPIVARDQRVAAELGVSGTPTVFINGRKSHAALLTPSALQGAIMGALAPIMSPAQISATAGH